MQSDFEILISGKQIAEKVQEIGAQITRDFQNRELVIIGVLRGCFVFMADLARAIDLPVAIDFMEVSSYGDDLESSGNVKIIKDIKDPIHGKHVLLIEDIIDTGHTLNFVVDHLKLKNPASIGIAGLLIKKDKHNFRGKIDYSGFDIADHFVVGYGMDAKGLYRNLDHVAIFRA